MDIMGTILGVLDISGYKNNIIFNEKVGNIEHQERETSVKRNRFTSWKK